MQQQKKERIRVRFPKKSPSPSGNQNGRGLLIYEKRDEEELAVIFRVCTMGRMRELKPFSF